MSSTDKSTTSTPTTTVPDWDELPCVQYGSPTGKGPARAPKLRTIFEPIPDDATTASPIYKVPREQYERQAEFESGYEVKGATSIATEIQDECEGDDRVLYPVHIESDTYHEEGPETLLSWFRQFVEDDLDVPFDTCTLYFSGNRSIHVHVPRFVSGEDDRERLKERAEEFCERTGADLDLGLYSRKRMFRLPGAVHEKTGLSKVEIGPAWGRNRIFRTSNEANPTLPETYAAVLRRVFASHASLTRRTAQPTDEPHDLFRVLDPEKTVLEFDAEEPEIEIPLIEQVAYPDDPADVPEWSMYNTHEFSPYALASGNGQSIAVVKVNGTPFARKDVTIGNASRSVHALIPVYFYGARGCAGEEFTKVREHAPLQLSKPDYEKWTYGDGDHVVIIGGKSNHSRIFRVDPWQATVAGHALTSDEGGRDTALDYLSEQGYDVGASGSSTSVSKRTTASRAATSNDELPTIWPARKNPLTEAEAFQRKAEQDGIETLSPDERWRVACRVLTRGWEPAWKWFREQFGAGFDPDITRERFRSVIEAYPDDYDHVEVPPQP